ncbi:hypothetical protein BO70DRAFT_60911 [Aspergillus heteromorphus CBS 117.55]|uniref:Uncharacterized protein n=1 Tax=Aspergillus heteromorphus CBS 117.55 TaxID=1448321 RepID=A0A317VWX6_9EURO|nr:uncharacterized protein BO70DRAFT_60911 [Aspergillus heteromorphus CBS 117.55]PWY78275.1 hypothetical protein BO70DRAFT_60911 [Aspergillus heteromorphus CBS 117.55]
MADRQTAIHRSRLGLESGRDCGYDFWDSTRFDSTRHGRYPPRSQKNDTTYSRQQVRRVSHGVLPPEPSGARSLAITITIYLPMHLLASWCRARVLTLYTASDPIPITAMGFPTVAFSRWGSNERSRVEARNPNRAVDPGIVWILDRSRVCMWLVCLSSDTHHLTGV